MKITMELNSKYIIFATIVMILSSLSGYTIRTLQEQPQDTSVNLSESDLNKMINLVIIGGHCERLGFMSAVYPQEDEQGNAYGFPICVEVNQNG